MGLALQLVAVVLIAYIAQTNSIRKAPTVSLTPKNVRGVEKGMVYMLCNTTGIPRPNITLYKDEVKVTNSRIYKFKILHGLFIRIGPLKQRHQGTYRCEAANGVGPVVSDSSAILRVYQAGTTPSGFPQIGRSPRSQFKRSGNKVIFQCTVTGTPKPSIMWLQNKVPLHLSNKRYSVSASGDLTIANLEKTDRGSYACVAKNSEGMVISREARLLIREVRRAPQFVVRPLDQTVNPDSDVYLKCSATGLPKPGIVWEVDGRRISGGADGYLVINRIQRSGNYTCIADNFMGRVSAYAFVKVKPYHHLGCYADNVQDRVFSRYFGHKSVEECALLALKNNYKVFGIEKGVECWSGSEVEYKKHGIISNHECKLATDVYVAGGFQECPATEFEGLRPNSSIKSCKDFKARNPDAISGVYWMNPSGQADAAFQGYCDMETAGGGWTLVFSYTFTNFANFQHGSNSITPQPSWPASGNIPRSTTAPLCETHYAAMDFNLWKTLGTEFMIKSNINHWIKCKEGTGSLVNWRTGSLSCKVVKNIANACHNYAPNKIQFHTVESSGQNLGPDLIRTSSTTPLKEYYYLEASTQTGNWPTHDPCGTSALYHVKGVHDPHGNIFIR